jgi:DNA-binding beta-propeller fold protein YncE
MHHKKSLSRRAFLAVAAAGAGGAWLAGAGCAAAKEPATGPFTKRLAVHPFPRNLDWINVARPIDLHELHGKFVLLDFWTLGCINCMHIIPELRKLEQAWPNELVVIGVHSGKFEGEKQTANIQQAVRRYRIEHPVVNDARFAIWDNFHVQAWPSLVLIDPEGYAVWGHSGEVTFEQVDGLLRKAVPLCRKNGTLSSEPISLDRAPAEVARTPLRFPGKILADEKGKRLFIADSGHDRVVVAGLDGSLLATIGSGTTGRTDGDYATAQFNTPQGMALDGETLYVADTENHLIRQVDLAAKRVSTLAGTGRQNREPAVLGRQSKPLSTALSSPWDVLVHGGNLYIAMAGLHQIWILRPGTGIGLFAGNGIEDIVDGRLGPRRPYQTGSASFAQPSGLATDGQWLYVADSEGSSIRAVPLDGKKEVRTLVGTARLPAARLFTFGDIDGQGAGVRLQHPLGLAFYEGRLYVVDTYNNKLKVIDPASGETRTLAGSTAPGRSDEPPAFDEPGGIAAAAGKLYVADTDNHAIRIVDLRRGNRVSTLSIRGLQAPKS